jgi:hypothetical protein
VVTDLDELDASRRALDMGTPGDVVVLCVDRANEVWKELQRRQHGASSGGHSFNGDFEAALDGPLTDGSADGSPVGDGASPTSH